MHAAAVLVQSKAEEGGCGAGACTATFPGNVTTGNTVIVAATCVNSCSSTTFTASDATNGSYTKHIENSQSNRTATILSFRNATGGFSIVTVTPNAGTPTMEIYLHEVSGLSNSATIQTGMNTESSVTSANSSSTGLSGTGFGVTTGAVSGSPDYTPGSGWTQTSADTIFAFSQRQIATFSSNKGPFTMDSAQFHSSVMAIFPEATAGGCHAALSLLGVGGC